MFGELPLGRVATESAWRLNTVPHREDAPMKKVVIRFGKSFDLRQAINLPRLIALLPLDVQVALDFSDVQFSRESAWAALIPAIASLRGRVFSVRGLERAELEPLAVAA
jgi:hypothetical protein